MSLDKTRRIVFGFLIASIIFFLYSDQLIAYISTLNPIVMLIISYLLSPMFILLLYFLYREYGFLGIISGFIYSIASSIITLPHLIMYSGQPSTASLKLFTDNIVFDMLPDSIKTTVIKLPIINEVNLGVFVMYVLIPFAMIIIALMISQKKKGKEIFYKAV